MEIVDLRLRPCFESYRKVRFFRPMFRSRKQKFFFPPSQVEDSNNQAETLGDRLELLVPKDILVSRNRKIFEEILRFHKSYRKGDIGWNYHLDNPWIIQNIDFKPDMRILDFGCGHGAIHVYIEEKYGCNVVGIDRKLSPIVDHVVDGATLPFPDDYFDVVYAASSLEHNDPEAMREGYAEIMRVLRPGGKFIATVAASKTDHYFAPSFQWNLTEETLCGIFEVGCQGSDFDHIRNAYRNDQELRRKYSKRYGHFNTEDPVFVVAGIVKTK